MQLFLLGSRSNLTGAISFSFKEYKICWKPEVLWCAFEWNPLSHQIQLFPIGRQVARLSLDCQSTFSQGKQSKNVSNWCVSYFLWLISRINMDGTIYVHVGRPRWLLQISPRFQAYCTQFFVITHHHCQETVWPPSLVAAFVFVVFIFQLMSWLL